VLNCALWGESQTNYVQEVPSTYASDMSSAMQSFFDVPQFSDLVFIVGDQRIHAVRLLLARLLAPCSLLLGPWPLAHDPWPSALDT
jgi:hypothetical protein